MTSTSTSASAGGGSASPVPPGRPRQSMIEIDQLHKFYGPFEALKGISFTVRSGEVVGFLGPNGAGKSTTMKIMTGLMPPTRGSVSIAGHDVLDEPLEVRRAIGYLPEIPPLYPEMTVRDYLSFAAELRGVPRARRRRAVDLALERCGLTHMAQRLVGNLSKGYRQRTGLAQAVIHEPRVLILDEPTVGLDPTQVIEIRGIVRELGEERTVILSSHVLPEVQATCHRVVIINRGLVVADGPMDELLSRESHGGVVASLRRPPEELDPLRQLTAVRQVQRLGEQEFRFFLEPGDDVRERFVAGLANSGYGLIEVRAETATLEEVFRDVVLEEVPA
ncbi:MAG: ATP-binding cassette domain-containing protein [Acidobacteriota bacterium]|nr:MAG: ATP-binding cassette domain-containing protein [Acidobacteriota bacterium]